MPEQQHLNVVTLCESNFRDPAKTLRVIADAIEAGEYGEVGSVGVVVFGDTLEVFGMGSDSDACTIACTLQAGAMRLITALETHGKE